MSTVCSNNRRGPPYFSVISCMLSNRGIGKDGTLCWPKLSKDLEHLMNLCYTPKKGKKNIIIKGRTTWEGSFPWEKSAPDVCNIVISNTYKECPEHCHRLVHSFEEALQVTGEPDLVDVLDEIWILGGVDVYKRALVSPQCHRLYLTRVQAQFDCDVFFPEFESNYYLTNDPDICDDVMEQHDIKYQFEVYENKNMI